jgi:site-specific DNA-methyltransferase (adenine-specific)
VGRLWRDGGPKIRLVWIDPPYGVSYAAKNEFLNAIDRGNRVQVPIVGDHMSDEDTVALFRAGLQTAVAHAAPGAACYACYSGPLLAKFIEGFDASGFTFKHVLVWVKQQFVIGRSDYHYRHELILYGWIENGAHYFAPDRRQNSVFEVDKPHVSDLHSTMKPVELCARMITNSTRPRELVMDPFAGSCTTGVAAHQLGRIAYLVEIDEGYAAVRLQRLSELTGLEPKLLDG